MCETTNCSSSKCHRETERERERDFKSSNVKDALAVPSWYL